MGTKYLFPISNTADSTKNRVQKKNEIFNLHNFYAWISTYDLVKLMSYELNILVDSSHLFIVK